MEYPPIGTLFTIKLGEKCFISPISEQTYTTKRDAVLKKESRNASFSNEMPLGVDLRTCFYASSILKSQNHEELKQIIEDGCSRNLLKGKRLMFIGYDTNALRHRVNQVVESLIAQKSRSSKSPIGFCLCGIVRSELSFQWDKKYKSSELSDIRYQFAQNFLNQAPKSARMARLGAVEYKHLMTQTNCEEIEGRGRGDQAIINAYESFAVDRNVDLVLISGDDNFTAMAHDEKIQAPYMKLPEPIREFTKFESNWDQIIDLIYCTAIVFGYIKFEDTEIYGVWRGKLEDDWDQYRINFDLKDINSYKKLFKDIMIIENSEIQMANQMKEVK